MADDETPHTPDDVMPIGADAPDDTATLEPDHALPAGMPAAPPLALESSSPPPSAWAPEPLQPRPPWQPAAPREQAQAAVEAWDASPAGGPSPRPAQQYDEVDPDHFAIAEGDDGADTILDGLFGWFGRSFADASEINESEDARAERAKGWTSRTILIAALALLVMNARSISTWASTLDPQWGTETLRLVSGEWAGRLQDAGFDEPRRRVHAAYQTSKTLDWKGGVKTAR
jgi:hypothetical protein